MASYVEKIARLQAEIAATPAGSSPRVGLAKSTSNLFRDRAPRSAPRIDLKHFNRVVAFDRRRTNRRNRGDGHLRGAGGGDARTRSDARVVPQLRSITVGGAMAGVGIEATSFRHGLVHDTALALEVLTGDGRVVICRPDNEHSDLFFGFPNSYGTLGYALKLTMRTQPVRKFVQVEHVRFSTAAECFAGDRPRQCASGCRFSRRRRIFRRRNGGVRSAASSTRRHTSATTVSNISTTVLCASARATF